MTNALKRVVPGISCDSHAAQCAEIYGIPQRLADRARHVRYVSSTTNRPAYVRTNSLTLPHSNLLSMHELLQLLDEDMSQDEIQDLEDAQEVFRRFLAWDIQKELEQDEVQSGTVKEKLAKVLGRS